MSEAVANEKAAAAAAAAAHGGGHGGGLLSDVLTPPEVGLPLSGKKRAERQESFPAWDSILSVICFTGPIGL